MMNNHQAPNPANSPANGPAGGPRPLRLEELLRQLPSSELRSLIQRLGISTDEAKRIDVPSQVARALLVMREVRDPSQLPGPTRELLYRIAEAGGVLTVDRLSPAVEPLVARGVVFVRGDRKSIELHLPIAFLLQMKTWEGEDPRGIRALLSQSAVEVASSIASHYLGRPATPPVILSLEPAWEALSNPGQLACEVEQLAPLERKLLRAVEEVGGEVDTEELLDLEREPMRLRGATGATPSRRGVGFALERRGFLIPVHPNRHVIPSEVAAVVGAQRRADREAQRRDILSFVLGEDHAPRRARFAEDPVPLALAMALAARDPSVEVRTGVGTPRSLLAKFSSRFGRPPETVALIAALSRAIGLWDGSVITASAPPGSALVHDLGRIMFNAWRRGGAWDEGRADGEVLRAGSTDARDTSPIGVIRGIVLEALSELGTGNWAPWEAVAAYVRADARTPGVARLIERWSQRAGMEATTPAEIARRIAMETLHVLGVVDLGEPEETEGERIGPTLRITPRGRAFLAGEGLRQAPAPSRFLDNEVLRIGGQSQVGRVIGLAPFVEVGSVSQDLDVSISAQTLSLALSAGFEPQVIQARLSAVAQLPDPIARLLVQASAVVGRAEFVSTEGFLWVEDPEVRELLRTRRQTADLFVDPSPPAGLLVAPGVDVDRLARRSRALGVEVIVDGEVHKARSMLPGSRSTGTMKAVRATSRSSAAMKAVRPGGRSSASMKAIKPSSRSSSALSTSRSSAVAGDADDEEDSLPDFRPASGTRPRARRTSSIPPAKDGQGGQGS